MVDVAIIAFLKDMNMYALVHSAMNYYRMEKIALVCCIYALKVILDQCLGQIISNFDCIALIYNISPFPQYHVNYRE